jgi:hypothetical protein
MRQILDGAIARSVSLLVMVAFVVAAFVKGPAVLVVVGCFYLLLAILPLLLRRFGAPEWSPKEAYITRLRRWGEERRQPPPDDPPPARAPQPS